MSRPPVLEIFVPYWGDPALLDACIDSVLAQDDPDWVMTIVDDCYPDATVARRLAAEPDARITYLRNERNLGITGNYERCRELATGDLMMFLGCDDLLLPDFVRRIKDLHREFPRAAILQVGVRVVDEHGTPIDPLTDKVKRAIMPRVGDRAELGGERLAQSLLRGDWLYWPSLVFRTDALRDHPFREGLPIIQDLALVIDMTAAGETLALDRTVSFAYRRHTASASSSSLLHGSRFADERRYYRDAAAEMAALGWRRAARTARLRWTSRLHAATLVPGALAARDRAGLRTLWSHAAER
ncbi:MAG: glycosyl transferase, family 2 [uncultured Nocardioides sp.]|uniref:Glycosyl transferase, family 2 n=1 Tax=uncultured Nocardioides sp. TaxID=198441 RepID=A0A6J4NJ21_9ACTN|nr:MAG: glycosyl transferase, family 2 [uncultured Nocardioides sp.]